MFTTDPANQTVIYTDETPDQPITIEQATELFEDYFDQTGTPATIECVAETGNGAEWYCTYRVTRPVYEYGLLR